MNRVINIMTLMRKAYFKNFQGPFFIFGFPLILLVIMGLIITNSPSMYAKEGVGFTSNMVGMNGYTLLSIVICLGAMSSSSLSIISIPQQITQFKETIIIKRIAITPIRKYHFIIAGLCFALVLAFISTCWILIWSFILFHSSILDALKYANEASLYKGHIKYGAGAIFSIIFGWFLVVAVASSFGLIIAGVAKNQSMAMGMAMAFYFPMVLLSGATLPSGYLERSSVLQVISYFVPIKYPVEMMNIGFLFGGQGIFQHVTVLNATNFHWNPSIPENHMYQGSGAHLYHENIFVWSLPLIAISFTTAFSLISVNTFKWEV